MAKTMNTQNVGGPIYVHYYLDRKGEWRWTIKSAMNGKKLANGGEGYIRRADCEKALRTIAQYIPNLV